MKLAERTSTSHTEHIPVRTCAGCRQRDAKHALLRMARDPRGGVRLDRDQRAPGRGTYVHCESRCIDRATRRGGVARRLRVSMSPEETASLRRELDSELTQRAESPSRASAVGAALLEKGQS